MIGQGLGVQRQDLDIQARYRGAEFVPRPVLATSNSDDAIICVSVRVINGVTVHIGLRVAIGGST